MKIRHWTLAVFLVFITDASAVDPATVAKVGTGKKAPQRIVSINLCTDELLLQLVGPERVTEIFTGLGLVPEGGNWRPPSFRMTASMPPCVPPPT